MADIALDTIKEETLLQTRIRDLPLQIPGTWLEQAITTLYRELDQKQIPFHPECYLADEWFSPDGEPVIGIPFYLAHPRLIALEEHIMLEAEGSNPEWCMRLLRHEAAHALSHAYRLQKLPNWRRTFGNPAQPYAPETARPRLYSRGFVTNLEKGYAQSHPDEDWAETFAVWLNPESHWATQYRGWPALKKIQYVDRLMRGVHRRRPVTKRPQKICQASRLQTRLGKHYAHKRSFYREEFPEFFDSDLMKIFSADETEAPGGQARRFLEKHRRRLSTTVANWSRARRYTVDGLLKKLIARCAALKLHVKKTEAETVLEVSAYLTTLALNHFYTGKLKRTR
jgi:hypothetical protein